MCRNIKPLFNFDPPATEEELHDAALQFVRKVTGMQKPSRENEKPFNFAVEKISLELQLLLNSLETNFPKKNREEEREKARLRSQKRFRNV